MIFHATSRPDACIVEPELVGDARGSFARTWCREAFAERGLNAELAQCSLSYTRDRATLRGMHCQSVPHEPVLATFNIDWLVHQPFLSERDAAFPDFQS